MDEEEKRAILRGLSRKNAYHAFATAKVFERRLKKLRRQLKWLSFLGLIAPVLVGGVVLSFGSQSPAFDWLVVAAGTVIVVQAVISLWSLVADWEDHYRYSVESMAANYRLFEEWDELARVPPDDTDDFHARVTGAKREMVGRLHQDYKWGPKDWEIRRGMRAALREKGAECVSCGEVPYSMRSTSCPVCGRFGAVHRLTGILKFWE